MYNVVLDACLRRLREHLGIRRLDVRQVAPVRAGDDKGTHPLELRVATTPPTILAARLLATPPAPAELRHILVQARATGTKGAAGLVVLAPQISEEAAAQLIAAGALYADAQGNAYLKMDQPRVLVNIRVPRPIPVPQPRPGRLVEQAGLKVVHLLLARPGTATRTYRWIAREAGVALGTVAIVIAEAKKAGFLVQKGPDRWELQNREGLIDLFVRGYAWRLREACFLGRYRHKLADPMAVADRLKQRLDEARLTWALTGGVAARTLVGFLKPDIVTLFIERAALGALQEEPMLPDATGGQVILLEHFGPAVTGNAEKRTATPLLVYAELLQDGRARELETAQLVFDTHIRAGVAHVP